MKSFVNLLLFFLTFVTLNKLPWDSQSIALVHVLVILSFIYSVGLFIYTMVNEDGDEYGSLDRLSSFTNFVLLINSLVIGFWFPYWESPTFLGMTLLMCLIYSIVRAFFETLNDDLN